MPAHPKPGKRPKRRQPAHVPPPVLEKVTERDGHVCAWTGVHSDRLVPQHRQGGAGGRAGKHRLANVVWLDSLINGAIESDPDMQAEAKRRGIKVSVHEKDVASVPVFHVVHGWRLIDDAGGWVEITPAKAKQRIEG